MNVRNELLDAERILIRPAHRLSSKATKGSNPMPTASHREVVQLKVTLAEIEPPIWRRVLVPVDYTLTRLHQVIQIAFGWEDYHLHSFHIHGEDYAPPDRENAPGTNSEKVALSKLGFRLKTKIKYRYDFGDCWDHLILVEGHLLLEEPANAPVCLGGQRACPPEDCGGTPGYQEMQDALQDPDDPRCEEFKQWLGMETWDAESFDLGQVNGSLAKAFAPRQVKRAVLK
jgi:hypothetical protein